MKLKSNNLFAFSRQEDDILAQPETESLEAKISDLISRYIFQFSWQKKANHIRGINLEKYRHLLDWQQLDELLASCPGSKLKCFDNCPPISAEKAELLARWHQGQTLYIESIEKLVPALQELCQQISKNLKASARFYAFCSHPNQQGANLHCDRFDVLILQLQGNKKWVVQREQDKKAYLECFLQPDDVLYIPRGHWHFAVASEEESLHLTLGISFKNFQEVPVTETLLYRAKLKIKNKLARLRLKMRQYVKLQSKII